MHSATLFKCAPPPPPSNKWKNNRNPLTDLASRLCVHSIHLVQITHGKSGINIRAYLLNYVLFVLIVWTDVARVPTALLASSQGTVRRDDGCSHASAHTHIDNKGSRRGQRELRYGWSARLEWSELEVWKFLHISQCKVFVAVIHRTNPR